MSLLVLGATSLIARRTAERFAAAGHAVVLAGRDLDALEGLADHFRARFDVAATAVAFDAAADGTAHRRTVEQAWAAAPDLDHVLVAFGTLGGEDAHTDPDAARRVIDVNLGGAASVLALVAARLEAAGGGQIMVLGSVAGDRGRQGNYVYGAAKAGLAALASGLRQRLHPSGVHVMTVKPGFVDTPMTAGMDLPRPLVANADRVGRAIHRASRRRRNVVYVPGFWRGIMAVIRALPEGVFKRTGI